MNTYPKNLNLVFGSREIRPFSPVPKGKVRVRLSNKDVAIAFVRTGNGITKHVIMDNDDGTWSIGNKLGESRRISNWISVKDRQPACETAVLITNKGWQTSANVDIGFWDGEFWYTYDASIVDPTHWQPLPEPPESESEASI